MPLETLRRFLATHSIGASRIVVACSGGIDSTALLVAMSELGHDIVCAHVNHHHRGDESDGDEQFVRDLCARVNVPIEVADGTLDAAEVKRAGVEAAAREV